MKILFITSSSINGGAQKHIRDMFRCLSKQKHEMYLVAPKGWLVHELIEFKHSIFILDSKLSNVNKLVSIIRYIKPDITNTFILSGGCFGIAAWKQVKSGKIFVTVNNPVIYDGISILGKLIYPYLYKWMSKYASAFLVKADRVAEEVKMVVNGRVPAISIKNGIDFSIFDVNATYDDLRTSLGVKTSDIVVTTVAALHERKGQQHTIEAIYSLRKLYPVHLILAGEGPCYHILQDQIKSLNAQNYIHLIGRRDDVNCVLHNSDIFVLSSYHEGLPNALMEAMAMQLPCIATNVGGVGQLIEDKEHGIIINSKSADEIYYAIEYLIKEKVEAKRMALAAKELIEKKYRQEIVAGELLDIYNNL